MEVGFFAPSRVGYENIFLPVLSDTSDEAFMCSLRIVFTLSIVLSACFVCFLVLSKLYLVEKKHLKPVALLAFAQAFVLRTKWQFVIL